MKKWYVTLSRTEARLFSKVNLKRPARLVAKIEDDLAQERDRDLRRHRSGTSRYRTKSSTITHSLTGDQSPHEDAALQFARQVAKRLDTERKKGSFESMAVFADPHMLGLVKMCLTGPTLKRVKNWAPKNLAKWPDHRVMSFIDELSSHEMDVAL